MIKKKITPPVNQVDSEGEKWKLIEQTETHCLYEKQVKRETWKKPFNGALPPDDYQISN
jgi:hypothetical protein